VFVQRLVPRRNKGRGWGPATAGRSACASFATNTTTKGLSRFETKINVISISLRSTSSVSVATSVIG
jgi:hypothetical protein